MIGNSISRLRPSGLLGLGLALALTCPGLGFAEDGAPGAGQEAPSVAALPPIGDHWLWVPDRLIQHNILYDGDSGEVLGMVDSPCLLTPKTPLVVRSRGEIYSVDIAHSRGTRGDRVDYVSIYDLETLAYEGEIVFPTRVGSSNTSRPYAELIGERFLGVFNQFPNISVSIIDLVERRFVEEILISGCAGVFPIDSHRFASLCGNGTALQVELDDEGHRVGYTPSAKFFDVVADPVAMSAGNDGPRWTFVSFAGQVHTLDFSGPTPTIAAPWSLLSDSEKSAHWRPGGLQYVALHGGLDRLYVVMHQGEAGSHKEPGREIWVYDLAAKRRLARFETPNLTASFLASFMGIEPGSFTYSLMSWLLPDDGVHTIAVSQDPEPLLFVRNGMLGSVGVLDARSGETLRFLTEVGLTGPTLRVP